MLKKRIDEIKTLRKDHPSFFLFTVVVLALYAVQFIIRTEITPLGYFALYSDPMREQETYKQILPVCRYKSAIRPVNIYKAPGQAFLMLEILPTRYDILKKSDHCNQMNHKLQRLGLHDNNMHDCKELDRFNAWLNVYMKRVGFDSLLCDPVELGFRKGQLKTYRVPGSTTEHDIPQ